VCARPPASARARWSRQSRFTVDFSVRGGGSTGASAGPSTDQRVAFAGPSTGRWVASVIPYMHPACMHTCIHACIHTYVHAQHQTGWVLACFGTIMQFRYMMHLAWASIVLFIFLVSCVCNTRVCVYSCVCNTHVCVHSCVCNTRVCVQVWTREQKRLWRTHCVENTFYSSVCGSTRHAWTHVRLTLAAYRRCVCVCVCAFVCVCLCACGLTLDYNVLCIHID